jgi:hypothetical protein
VRFITIRPALLTPKKICKDCKFFIANKNECALFGETNLVTGKQSYEYASSVRRDKEKCGDAANYFEENTMKIVTVPYYFWLDYGFLFSIIGVYSFIVAIAVTKH